MTKKILFAALMAVSSMAAAQPEPNTYFGGGLSSNDLDVPGVGSATGFQFFAGLPLDLKIERARAAVEFGYMNSGEFDYGIELDGIWVTGVAILPLANKLNVLGRAGLDFGDDDGLMLGFGLGYTANKNIEFRGEYVMRNDTDSLQINLVYRP